MLLAAEFTGDSRYRTYTDSAPHGARDAGRAHAHAAPGRARPRPTIPRPRTASPCVRCCCRAHSTIPAPCARRSSRPSAPGWVANNCAPGSTIYVKYMSTGQFRLADGTLARNRPLPNSLWLDDLYMSVPCLAQAGKLTGERRYYDDAARQILQFSARMFVPEQRSVHARLGAGHEPLTRRFIGRAPMAGRSWPWPSCSTCCRRIIRSGRRSWSCSAHTPRD